MTFNMKDAKLILGDRQYQVVNVSMNYDMTYGERIDVEATGPGEPIELEGKSLKDIGLILSNLYEQVQEQADELKSLRSNISKSTESISLD